MSYIAHEEEYRGYTIKIETDEDCGNPIKECDELLTIVLHEKAERRFGWTTDEHYAALLNYGMDNVRTAKSLGQAIAIVTRWLKAFHGVTVALPIGALDHSGVAVYLGSGDHPQDPGGWDSGWIGLAIDTPERRKVMGFDEPGTTPAPFTGQPWNHPETVEAALRQDFKTFKAWVEGDCYGWVVEDQDEEIVESVWGYYGDGEWRASEHYPDGYMVQEARSVIDHAIGELQEQAIAEDRQRCYDEAWEHHARAELFRRQVNEKEFA